MTKRLCVIVLLLVGGIVIAQAVTPKQRINQLKQRLKDHMEEPFDTIRDSAYWKRALVHGKLDIYDESVPYPRFLDFCARAYRWGDRVFNTYDTAYVVATGKPWKIQFKTNSWFDSFHGDVVDSNNRITVRGNLATSLGFRLSFMAVGFEYMPDIDNLISGDAIKHRKTRFTFMSSRVAAEASYIKSHGTTHIKRLGDYNDGKSVDIEFDGFDRRTLGLEAMYFFNNKHYAHAAAYGFSKYQRRSAGTLLLGLQYCYQKLAIDFEQLPDEVYSQLTEPATQFESRYHSYTMSLGYAYNWSLPHDWLINITLAPSIGWKYGANGAAGDDLRSRYAVALNIRGQMAIVKNCGRFFYALHGNSSGVWYTGKKYRLFSIINDFTAIAGFRF